LALFDPADEDLHYEIVEILIASEARAELRRALESGSDAQIELVAQALSRMNPPAVAELRSGLGSPRARVKAAALAGLRTAHQMARDPGIPSRAGFATSEVAPLLGDADANVRVAAVDLLNAIGPPDNTLVPRLSALLRDNDARVRRAAAQAVGVFYPQAKAHASEIVRLSQDPDGAVRAAAYATLAVWPLTEERRAMLIAALDDASAEVRVAVLNAAGERSLGISTLPRISALLNDPRCAAYAAAAIGAMGPAAATAVPQVARLLHGGDSFSRAMACRGLIRLGPAGVTAVAAALPALTAMDKAMALEMLGKAGTAARAAMPAIKKLAADPDENVRSRAERALAAIAGDR
jgi:HEAT repeat protein